MATMSSYEAHVPAIAAATRVGKCRWIICGLLFLVRRSQTITESTYTG